MDSHVNFRTFFSQVKLYRVTQQCLSDLGMASDGPGLYSDPVVDQKDRGGTLSTPTNSTDSPGPQAGVSSESNYSEVTLTATGGTFPLFSVVEVSEGLIVL